jgi:hypothetical protein
LSSELELIEKLASEGSHASANKLDELERSSPQREIRKAARKALYRLSQIGILPSRREKLNVTQPASVETLRAFASAFDGAGNRLILFLVPDPDGGSSTLLQIRTNDTQGVETCDSLKIRRREQEERVNIIESQVETGLAVAEIDPDYGRRLLARSRALGASLSRRSPAALLSWLGKIGEASGGSTAESIDEDPPPIYTHVTEEAIRSDDSISTDALELFKLSWFEPWFFAAEDTMPWLPRWEQALVEAGDNSDAAPNASQDQIISEAAARLMTDTMRKLYVYRLEETADVLWRCGKVAEAKQAVYHAIILKSSGSDNVAAIPFVHEIARRTLGAAFEMVRIYRERRAGG